MEAQIKSPLKIKIKAKQPQSKLPQVIAFGIFRLIFCIEPQK
jgi:hypothetical protein